MKHWAFPEKLPTTFKPKPNSSLAKVFKDSVALVIYAQYKRNHIVEKNENLWLPHFALLFSKIIKDLRTAGSLSFTLVLQVWQQLWRQNPMYLMMGYHSDMKNYEDMIAAIMPFINGEKKLQFIIKDDGKAFLVTKETTRT